MYLDGLLTHQKIYVKANQGGLALIEVLLSLGLSSVMLLVLFTAQTHNQKGLIYSQPIHFLNRRLMQVASQMWAYPNYFQTLVSNAAHTDVTCLNERFCKPLAMTQAWASYWSLELQKLPNAELYIVCLSSCTQGGTAVVSLTWSQSLALATSHCEAGFVCTNLKLAL